MKMLLLVVFMLQAGTAYSGTLEIENTVKETDAVAYKSVAFIFDGRETREISYSVGVTVGELNFQSVKDSVNLAGIDAYAKIIGGPLSMRWGFGIVAFDKTIPEKVENPWNFHISMQSGFRVSRNIMVALSLHHWSNGLAFIKKFGLESYWPKTNMGGNTLALGIMWSL